MEHFHTKDKLHTDVLEAKYGNISAKILKHNKILREAHLVDDKGVSKTYALTFFSNKFLKEIAVINSEIRAGEAIGKAFRNHKFAIRKNVIDVYVVKLNKGLKAAFHTSENFAKARLSEFYAKKQNKKPTIYGTVIEIYSPDFRKPVLNKVDISQINPTTKAFEEIGISMDEIWSRLGKNNSWNDIRGKYSVAKTKSLEYVKELEERIKEKIK